MFSFKYIFVLLYVILGKNLNNMIETQYLLASYIYLA